MTLMSPRRSSRPAGRNSTGRGEEKGLSLLAGLVVGRVWSKLPLVYSHQMKRGGTDFKIQKIRKAETTGTRRKMRGKMRV